MNTLRVSFYPLLAGIALLTLAACATVKPVNEIPEAIVSAKTAADHQRIADYFGKKAEGYNVEAKVHEKMRQSYSGNPSYNYGAMNAHCQELQKQLNAASQ